MAGRVLIAMLAATLAGSAAPQTNTLKGSAVGAKLQFDRVPMSLVADAIMRRVSDRPFVLCDTVLTDNRPVSLRLEPYQLNLRVISGLFASYGFRVSDRGGILYVCDGNNRSAPLAARTDGAARADGAGVVAVPAVGGGALGAGNALGGVYGQSVAPAAGIPLGSPLTPSLGPVGGPAPAAVSEPSQLLGYRPDFISPDVLAEAVRPMFPEVRFSVVQGGGQRAALFASGPVESVERFEKMAQYLDRAPEAVEVQAIIVEVTSGSRTGFGVSMILDALRSTVGFTVAGPQLENQLTFRSGSFEGVLSAVSSSSSTRVLSSPRLLGRSGERLRLQVGNSVPTLSAVIDRPSGSTQQSVTYQPSGTIFEVVPEVLGKRIGLTLHQELSAFAATETGVQGSPTLTTRQLDSTLDLESGEWAVIGGLTTQNDDRNRQTLFGLVPIGKVRTERRAELVLLLNVRRLDTRSRYAAGGAAGGKDAAARN